MARYLSFRNGNKTDEHGLLRYITKSTLGSVISGLTTTQNGTPNMTVLVLPGDVVIRDSSYAYEGWSDANESLNIGTADPTNPRIDVVVAYIDKSLVDATNSNSPTGLKLAVVAGTPAASPSAPSSGTIQTAVGASNPYTILSQVRVNAAVTSVVDANITDVRDILKSVVSASDDWISANESWTFSAYNATTREGIVNVPSDATLKYTKGYRGRMVQATGGVKHFIITDVTATQLYLFFESGKTLANEVIVTPKYSPINATGFPTSPLLWSLVIEKVTTTSQSSPTNGVWYNLGDSQVVPRGAWKLKPRFAFQIIGIEINVTLATVNNAVGIDALTVRSYDGSSTTRLDSIEIEHDVLLTANTTYFMNCMNSTSNTQFDIRGASGHRAQLKAICNYL